METIQTEIPDDSKPTDAAPVKKSILEWPGEINPKPKAPNKRKEPRRPRGRPKKEEHEKKQLLTSYYQEYYHAKLKHEVQCKRCKMWVTKGNISKHRKAKLYKLYDRTMPFARAHVTQVNKT